MTRHLTQKQSSLRELLNRPSPPSNVILTFQKAGHFESHARERSTTSTRSRTSRLGTDRRSQQREEKNEHDMTTVLPIQNEKMTLLPRAARPRSLTLRMRRPHREMKQRDLVRPKVQQQRPPHSHGPPPTDQPTETCTTSKVNVKKVKQIQRRVRWSNASHLVEGACLDLRCRPSLWSRAFASFKLRPVAHTSYPKGRASLIVTSLPCPPCRSTL